MVRGGKYCRLSCDKIPEGLHHIVQLKLDEQSIKILNIWNLNERNKTNNGRGDCYMSMAKDRLLEIIDEIPEQEVDEILDYAEYLKAKRDKNVSKDLVKASESNLSFWDNDLDDEVWNNV